MQDQPDQRNASPGQQDLSTVIVSAGRLRCSLTPLRLPQPTGAKFWLKGTNEAATVEGRPSSTSSRSGGRTLSWALLSLGEATRARQAGDLQAMRQAAERLSEGLTLYRSGLSTHLTRSPGQTPAQAALGWYRSQMGLPAATAAGPRAMNDGVLWGLS